MWLGELDDTLLGRLNEGLDGLMRAIDDRTRSSDDPDAPCVRRA
jgi:hypothetical protein